MADEAREVVIVGGGLAGLSAAYRLASLGDGRGITIYEMRQNGGGKARSLVSGSEEAPKPFNPYRPDDDLSWLTPTVDKGYHIFPAWYWELWDLVETIGITDNFFPRRKDPAVPNPQSRSYALFMPPLEDLSYEGALGTDGAPLSRVKGNSNKKSFLPDRWWMFWQIGPPLSMFLTAVGLASTSGRTVEEMTVPDFISTRWYNGSERSSVLQDMIVKALANPSKHSSAYTMRQMFRRWIPTALKWNSWTPARGPLQTCLIDPIVAACDEKGVRFERAELTAIGSENGRIVSLDFGDGRHLDVADADVVIALPHDVLLDVIKEDRALLAVRTLSQLTHLRTAPMGAIDLYFTAPHEDYPKHLEVGEFMQEHFTLIESEFGLTGFQISGIEGWEDHLGGAPGLVLQFVVGNAIDIHAQPLEDFARSLIDSIAEYLDFDPERDLIGCVAIPSAREQLTMNDAGTWDKRPPANVREVENLFLAGDYVKLSVDVAGMEAAVESGANAARAIVLEDLIRNLPAGDTRTLHDLTNEAYELLSLPAATPNRFHQNFTWPLLRVVFISVNHVLGWFVMIAKLPLIAGHDFVGPLHDRYEDHREELVLDGSDRSTTVSRPRPENLSRKKVGLPVSVSKHQRTKGLGTPVDFRDRLLLTAGLIALVVGAIAAWVLPAGIDGYSHRDDAISVLGRESSTRPAYIATAAIGWIGMQLFAAVVRKFTPGSQVLTWMFAWLGWLWLVAAVFPICADDPLGEGTVCSGASDAWIQGVHYFAAIGMTGLYVLMPGLTALYFLADLPRGYRVNWRGFRVLSGFFAVAAAASAAYFALSLIPALDWPQGLSQRLHWSVGNTWVVALALWISFRRHRAITGVIATPRTSLRAVDQRSLWV